MTQFQSRRQGSVFGPEIQGPIFERRCAGCGKMVQPFVNSNGKPIIMVAHEFRCYKEHPGTVPHASLEAFNDTLAWERRSERAKAAARKRKRS